MQNSFDIVVIGAGPFGIASVVEAKRAGFERVALLEKGDNHSQTIRKFYKDGKRVDKDYKGVVSDVKGSVEFSDGTKESTLNYFDSLLDDGHILAVFNCEVEKVVKSEGGFTISTSSGEYSAKYVMIGIGRMGRPNKPSYKIPPSILPVVNFNLNSCNCGEEILVIGGGNSAAEYAVELAGCNKVTMCYRKASFSRLNEINEEQIMSLAKSGKMQLKLGVDILGLENESGKVRVSFDNGESGVFDRLVYAIGGSSPVDFLQKCGISTDEAGVPQVDENLQTNIAGLFVGGDIISKSGTSIVCALNDAYSVIRYIKNR